MRSTRILLAATAAVLLACTARVEVETDDSADIAAINAVREMEVTSALSGDMSMSYVADDVVIMPPNEPQVVGIEAARAWSEAFMNTMTIESMEYDPTEITVSGDWAIEHYTGRMTVKMSDAEEPMTESVKGLHVYRKGADGTWKMAMDVWNSSTPMEGGM